MEEIIAYKKDDIEKLMEIWKKMFREMFEEKNTQLKN